MKPKVLLIVPMLHQGGFERVCLTTARLLAPYADVTIVIFNGANIAYDITGLHILDINLGVKKGKLAKLFNICRRVIKVRKLKREMNPQVAYSFGPTANLVNAFSKTRQTKVWLGLRNYTDIEETVKMWFFVRLADLIVCCTCSIEAELRETYRQSLTKTAALYNPYDVEAIRREAAAGEPSLPWQSGPVLVSMGRDADQKGFWHLLKIFALIRAEIPEARLLILGAGTFSEYRRLAEEMGITASVCFAGMQTRPYQYLKKGSVYLLTSSNEGFPNALVEGMALGLAAVSADCKTGPAEILLHDLPTEEQRRQTCRQDQAIWGEYGILLPVMGMKKNLQAGEIEPEERKMAQIVLQLLTDPELLRRYQDQARERAGIFSYEAYRSELLRLLEIQ